MTRSPEPVRVLVADGQLPSRAGLRAALEDGGIAVVAEAARASEAVAQARLAQPRVSLVAAGLPEGALRAVDGILAHDPEGAVIVLADATTEDEALEALLAGASGYVDREVEPERLPQVVRAVAAGEVAVPRTFVATLLQELRILRGPGRERLDREHNARLSDREWEILALLDAGLDTGKIAGRLGVSPVTVRRHIGRLLARLGAPDRAAALAMLHGAIRPDAGSR